MAYSSRKHRHKQLNATRPHQIPKCAHTSTYTFNASLTTIVAFDFHAIVCPFTVNANFVQCETTEIAFPNIHSQLIEFIITCSGFVYGVATPTTQSICVANESRMRIACWNESVKWVPHQTGQNKKQLWRRWRRHFCRHRELLAKELKIKLLISELFSHAFSTLILSKLTFFRRQFLSSSFYSNGCIATNVSIELWQGSFRSIKKQSTWHISSGLLFVPKWKDSTKTTIRVTS